MDEDQECVICGEKLAPTDRANVGSKGLATLMESSIERGDDLINIWQTKKAPFAVHMTCRKNYTRKSTVVSSCKRKGEEVPSCDPVPKSTKLRSRTPVFNIKEDCLYCSKAVLIDQRTPTKRKSDYSEVATIEYLQKVTIQANQRKDDWGEEVKMRIQIASDLVAEEGKYHRRCAQLFYLGRQLDSCVFSRQSGRPVDAVKN